MKTPSLVIASIILLTATSAQAIDAEYRRLLERSAATQVTEAEGCDIHKTRRRTQRRFRLGRPFQAAPVSQVAERACLAKVAKTVEARDTADRVTGC